MAKIVKIKSYSQKVEAEMVKTFLEKNNIRSIITPETTGVAHMSLFNGPTQLSVREEDVEKALSILEEDIK